MKYKPPFKTKGEYPDKWIVDSNDNDVVVSYRVADIEDNTDYMKILCDALNQKGRNKNEKSKRNDG